MIKNYKNFAVEIIEESDASELEIRYQNSYPKDLLNKDSKYKPSIIYGIKISINGNEIWNASLSGFAGRNTLTEDTFILKYDCLFMCCSNYIYCLDIENLKCNWDKELDLITCFGIYEFNNHFIIHGEMCIVMINKNGKLIWEFYGQDIFLNPDGKDVFKINNNQIELIDWQGNIYILNSDGKEISQC